MRRQVLRRSTTLALVGVVVVGSLALPALAAQGDVVNYAGGGADGGDGGPAVDARLGDVSDVVMDPFGNAFISDPENRNIRMVDCFGTISTIARTRVFDSSGENPAPLAVDQAGNVYFGDDGLFKRNRDGAITQLLSAREFLEGARVGGLVAGADGSIFFSDRFWDTVSRFDPDTGQVSVVVGGGNPPRVVPIPGVDTGIEDMGDGGAAIEAHLRLPHGLALDPEGNLFIADRDDGRIRRVDAETGIISTVAGNGPPAKVFTRRVPVPIAEGMPATAATLLAPNDVAIDGAGVLYIADQAAHKIYKVVDGKIFTAAGSGFPPAEGDSGDGGPATEARFFGPSGIWAAPGDNLLIADRDNKRVRLLQGTGDLPRDCEQSEEIATTLTYTGPLTARGSTVEMSAQLLDVDGNPLVGQTIAFAIGGQPYEGLTDSSGTAVATAEVPDHGKSQTVIASFLGVAGVYSPSQTSAVISWGKPKEG